MKVRCISTEATPEQAKKIAKLHIPGRYGISIGEVYVVYSITIIEGIMWGDILSNSVRHLISVPIFLFEILDNRISQYWEIKIEDTGEILFWPHEFYKPYFHDKLSDYAHDEVEEFEQIRL